MKGRTVFAGGARRAAPKNRLPHQLPGDIFVWPVVVRSCCSRTRPYRRSHHACSESGELLRRHHPAVPRSAPRSHLSAPSHDGATPQNQRAWIKLVPGRHPVRLYAPLPSGRSGANHSRCRPCKSNAVGALVPHACHPLPPLLPPLKVLYTKGVREGRHGVGAPARARNDGFAVLGVRMLPSPKRHCVSSSLGMPGYGRKRHQVSSSRPGTQTSTTAARARVPHKFAHQRDTASRQTSGFQLQALMKIWLLRNVWRISIGS